MFLHGLPYVMMTLVTVALGLFAIKLGMMTLLPNLMLDQLGTMRARAYAIASILLGTLPMVTGGVLAVVTVDTWYLSVAVFGVFGQLLLLSLF
jgi:hypothetical protein